MGKMKYLICPLLITAGFYISSCTKEDDFKKIAAGGEIVYPGRADTVIVQPGYKRVQLRVVMGKDALVTKVKAFWNNKADSMELSLVRTPETDTVNMIIPNLNEGVYNFEVFTYDSKNNKSVATLGMGRVYGDTYKNNLANRTIKSVQQSKDGKTVTINWALPLENERRVEINYIDATGASQSIVVPSPLTSSLLPSYTGGSAISYRSTYLPEPTAIDSFVLNYADATLPIFQRELPKTAFLSKPLPTDIGTASGSNMNKLWDEVYGTMAQSYNTVNGALPVSFTFDMGVSAKLSKLMFWQPTDKIYTAQSVKKFEVWGSNSPATDGTWASWTQLGTFQSVKPSGLPLGQTNLADVDYTKAGETLTFPNTIGSYRYIRIKVLETWGTPITNLTMAEFSCWTSDN